jgi:ATP-dependent exoDNAse (exonuclease V) beta subunit
LLRYSPFKIPNKTLEINYEEIDYQLSLDRLFKSLLGTLIHQYFEFGLFDPNEGNIKLELKRTGISPNKINESVKFILKMLNNTKQDPIFSWLFKERESTLVEAEFIGEESIVVIDRLFIDDDILWIIDFKTSQPSDNEPLSSFVLRQQKEHNKQLLLYKEILASIYNNEIKCAIYCPSVQNLIEVH